MLKIPHVLTMTNALLLCKMESFDENRISMNIAVEKKFNKAATVTDCDTIRFQLETQVNG